MGRLAHGIQVPNAPVDPDPPAAPPAAETGRGTCSTMSTFLQRMKAESAAMPSERGPQSLKSCYLSEDTMDMNGRELTAEEELMFADELWEAKRKETGSWCDHDSFAIRKKTECTVKAQSSRWVNRWKLTIENGKKVWIIKCRLCPRG